MEEKDTQTIINWDYNDPEGVLRFMAERWRWEDWWGEKDGLWVFATGGWSEHEMMIGALYESMVWRIQMAFYTLYVPGGLLVIGISDRAKKKVRRMCDKIIDQAWKEVGVRK